jgi:7-cyano-7-deazaguanine reductase
VSREILETFPNPAPHRDYVIEHVSPEFTSVCPKTGQPDFATITLRYIADELCVELKSLKFYYGSYRSEGIYYEAVVNRILDDVVAVLSPRFACVEGEFAVRGGISSAVTAEYRKE